MNTYKLDLVIARVNNADYVANFRHNLVVGVKWHVTYSISLRMERESQYDGGSQWLPAT